MWDQIRFEKHDLPNHSVLENENKEEYFIDACHKLTQQNNLLVYKREYSLHAILPIQCCLINGILNEVYIRKHNFKVIYWLCININ